MTKKQKRGWIIFFGFLSGVIVARIYTIWALLIWEHFGRLSDEFITTRILWHGIMETPILTRIIIISFFTGIAVLFSNAILDEPEFKNRRKNINK